MELGVSGHSLWYRSQSLCTMKSRSQSACRESKLVPEPHGGTIHDPGYGHNTQAAGKCREQRILNMAGKKFLSLAYNDLFQNSYTDSDSE